MKLLGGLAVVLGCLLPTAARAQSVKPKDLVGIWSRGDKRNDTLFIRPNNTFTMLGMDFTVYGARPEDQHYRHWNYLRGDTISFSPNDSPDACGGESMGYCGEPGYKLTLKGKQLILTPLGKTGPWFSGTYTRVTAESP